MSARIDQSLVTDLHDRYVASMNAFNADPNPTRGRQLMDDHRAFYLAYVGRAGLVESAADMRHRIDRVLAIRFKGAA